MDRPRDAFGFHPACSVDDITPQVIREFVGPYDAGDDWSRIDADPQADVVPVKLVVLGVVADPQSQFSNGVGVTGTVCGHPGGDHVCIAHGFDLLQTQVFNEFIELGEPQRGDVVVFRLPSNPSINYIKRVVGLPGDQIVYANHQVTVNGQQMDLAKHPQTRLQDSGLVFIEQLDERDHEIRISRPNDTSTERVYQVPDGHYFMMGDNRDNSQDSRYIGAIPETHLVGEAVRIWMHMDGLEWPTWSRIGTKIQ